jgi:Tubulin like
MSTHDFTPGNFMNGALTRIKAISDDYVHQAAEHEGPFSLHVVGVGGTGAAVVERLLKEPPAGLFGQPETRLTGLVVDVDLEAVSKVTAAATAAGNDSIHTVTMAVPERDDLLGSLRRFREYLKMEYPRYYWNPNYEPWLPSDVEIPAAGESMPRAVAKAIYASEYYQGGLVADAMDGFARGVDDGVSTPIVCVVFSLAGGTGSGVVVDLARHLSSVKLGRRPWVVGIGVLPTPDDPAAADGGFFPVINELDCMVDSEKNPGVMAVWGDLYKNPFTGGFFAVSQDDAFAVTGGDLAATHEVVDTGIVNFIGRDGGKHLYETLKAVNWLSVEGSSWHPAIRSQPSDRWISLLTVRSGSSDAPVALGLEGQPLSEYVEMRVFGSSSTSDVLAQSVGSAVSTAVPVGVRSFAGEGKPLTLTVVPRLSKLDLDDFVAQRDLYDERTWDEKLLMHSWLLDLGVMLCEPSIRFDGLGGECIWGCACWVVVPHAAIRGVSAAPVSPEVMVAAATTGIG